jgi:ribosomal 50S subunit-recycling heat shock protein
MRRILDSEESRVERSRASVQSSASILEEAIVRMLCRSLARAQIRLGHVHLNEMKNLSFEDFIHRLKEAYLVKRGNRLMLQSAQLRPSKTMVQEVKPYEKKEKKCLDR